MEVANEYLVLTSTYFLFLYSDGFLNVKSPLAEMDVLLRDQELFLRVGTANTSLLGVLVVLNMGVMMTVQIKDMIRKIKLRYLKHLHGKTIKEFLRIQEAKKAAYALKLSENDLPLRKGSIMKHIAENVNTLQSKTRQRNAKNSRGVIKKGVEFLNPIQEAESKEEADQSMVQKA